MIILVTILLFMVGIYLGLIAPYIATELASQYGKNKEMANLIPTRVDAKRLCNGPHSWLEGVSVNEKGEYSPLNICRLCGFIPSKDLMATKEGLVKIVENNQLREFEAAVERDFEEQENADIKKLLEEEFKNGLTYGKVNEIYHAGQTSQKRYIMYKIARSEEMRRKQKEQV